MTDSVGETPFMAETVKIDLRHVARGLPKVSLAQVQAVVELLDEGNTVPFITRYRKDLTGGLDEEAIRHIHANLGKMRALNERKNQILRSLETRGKLAPELMEQVAAAGTTKRLEDLYLPYRPKKTTLATAAKAKGLEPLAGEILRGAESCSDLDARAADYINPDEGVVHAADALLGAGHVIAEWFSENVDLRQKLRNLLTKTARITSAPTSEDLIPEGHVKKDGPAAAQPPVSGEASTVQDPPRDSSAEGGSYSAPISQELVLSPRESEFAPALETSVQENAGSPSVSEPSSLPLESIDPTDCLSSESCNGGVVEPAEDLTDVQCEDPCSEIPAETSGVSSVEVVVSSAPVSQPQPDENLQAASIPSLQTADAPEDHATIPAEPSDGPVAEVAPEAESNVLTEVAPEVVTVMDASASSETPPVLPSEVEVKEPAAVAAAGETGPRKAPGKSKKKSAKAKAHAQRLTKTQVRKQRAREKRVKAFTDYFGFSEEAGKIPPHRVLALNRGERAKVLRVGFDYEIEPFEQAIYSMVIPEDHPHGEFLRGCAKDSLVRLLLPSLERELRRELTEKAEEHAVTVFARNLRNLLVQPPVHGRRVLAVDPGFRNGCKLVALDQFGNILEHDLIFLVGKTHRLGRATETVKGLIDRFGLSVVAIGNGSGCRDAEEFISKLITEEYPDREIAYVIVNEAGASVYSISRAGRDDFPDYDATLRSAISIGRRLQDPLSELVKIDPASIGVGLYQHDVKAKHLRSSLDEVVESCVNFVGVDVNMASPALLRYVSGLNQLTARHVYEYRRRNGPFRNREELKKVQGVGQQTFTQAAGFLRITSGGQPFDATWIHPESYPVAEKLLAKIGAVPAEVLDKGKLPELARRLNDLNVTEAAAELEIGEWTLRDLVSQLTRPGRDPRDDLPKPVFKRGVLKIEDLEPGMELSGTVLNVVDFGVFVDIGLHDSGLVHVSHLADRFVRDPHDVVAVGNVVKVWVLEVDKDRRRVSLSMIPPGSAERAPRPKRERSRRPKREDKPPQQHQQRQPREGRDNRRRQGKDKAPRRAERVEYKPRASRPKPVIPITDEMLKGKEAMRTFGDLAQFFAKKQGDENADGTDAGGTDENGSPKKS